MPFLLCIDTFVSAQKSEYSINDTILKTLPQNVSIVALGDPSHQESTITKYRVDLIKKLVEERQFKIIAIEGNIYELYNAHKKFIRDNNTSDIERAMYNQLNIIEMEELYNYVYERNKKGDSLIIAGFDVEFSGRTFVENIKEDLKNINFLRDSEKEDFICELNKANISSLKAAFRNNKRVRSKIVHYSKLILKGFVPENESDFFFSQALKNIVFLYDKVDVAQREDNLRDLGMFKNIIFFKEQFKNEKIILFGSSTHLLKNPDEISLKYFKDNRVTLGALLDSLFNNDYYFIAYSSISGKKLNAFQNSVNLKLPIGNSIENENKNTGAAIFLNMLEYKKEKVYSRFLGHSFLELNFRKVVDGLVLIDYSLPAKIKKL